MKMLLALAGLLVTLSSVHAAEDPILAQLAGDWIGNGTLRSGPDAAPERILCHITSRLVDDGEALEQTGRCGVASNTGTISGRIVARGANRYEGTLQSMASTGVATLEGRARGQSLVLTTRFTDASTGESSVATTTLAIVAGGGYRLTSQRQGIDGVNYGETDILFKAR